MNELKHVQINWKFKDSPDHYEQRFHNEESIDLILNIWLDRYTEDGKDGDNPYEYCDWFEIIFID